MTEKIVIGSKAKLLTYIYADILNQKLTVRWEEGREELSIEWICADPPASAGVLFQLEPGCRNSVLCFTLV